MEVAGLQVPPLLLPPPELPELLLELLEPLELLELLLELPPELN